MSISRCVNGGSRSCRPSKRVIAEEEKRQERVRKAAEKKMGDYQTYADLQDAYGCGVITERQFDRLVALLEQKKPYPGALYQAKLELLQELYTEQKKILDDRLRWESASEGT